MSVSDIYCKVCIKLGNRSRSAASTSSNHPEPSTSSQSSSPASQEWVAFEFGALLRKSKSEGSYLTFESKFDLKCLILDSSLPRMEVQDLPMLTKVFQTQHDQRPWILDPGSLDQKVHLSIWGECTKVKSKPR